VVPWVAPWLALRVAPWVGLAPRQWGCCHLARGPGGPPAVHLGAASGDRVRKKVRLVRIDATYRAGSRNRPVCLRYGVHSTQPSGTASAISWRQEFGAEN
jgi:hypothetical protein